MSLIRTLIVDDEPLARRTLRLLLSLDDEVEIIGECRNGQEAAKRIVEDSPDLVFLDIQMPQMDGFEVIRVVGVQRMPVTVFVTAYDRYAVKAFEAEALDYLLKPFEDARFEKALHRAKAAIRRGSHNDRSKRVSSLLVNSRAENSHPTHPSRLLLPANGKVVFLDVEDIDWIDAVDYYIKIHAQKKTYLQRETMDSLEKRLDPQKFFRIHRSTIVNVDRVKELRFSSNGNYVAVLHDGTFLRVSRTRQQQLKALF